MRTKANNTLLEENEKLTEKRAVIYSLDKETRREILAFYHWELMTPAMIKKNSGTFTKGVIMKSILFLGLMIFINWLNPNE